MQQFNRTTVGDPSLQTVSCEYSQPVKKTGRQGWWLCSDYAGAIFCPSMRPGDTILPWIYPLSAHPCAQGIPSFPGYKKAAQKAAKSHNDEHIRCAGGDWAIASGYLFNQPTVLSWLVLWRWPDRQVTGVQRFR